MRYVPVDVCGDYLQAAARDLRRHFPELSVLGVVADFTRHLQALPNTRQRLFLFLGGTLGNFADDEALEFLTRVSRSMHSGDHFILGLDMAKSRTVLERAYNDARGVTAAFNKNILRVVNNELNATFDPDLFEHRAFFNPQKSRVEMHLEALRDMEVEVADLPLRVPLARGETIHTEISRKFAPEEIETMASRAGLRIHRWTSDREGMFSLLDLVV
jgi:L-histidine N-alpha-methyltransferase